MKKLIVFAIIGMVLFFAGCTSQPDEPINNEDPNNQVDDSLSKTLYEQIKEEAFCPCSSRLNLDRCEEYLPDCEHLPIVDNIIKDMISQGASKEEILNVLEDYNKQVLEDRLKEVRTSQESDKVILIYFKSEVCQICVEREPVLNEIRSMYRDKVDMYEFDARVDRIVFEHFGITRVPSIIFFDGKQRLNEAPFSNISIDAISSLLDYTLDKK